MFVLIEKPCIVQTGYIEVMLNQGLPTDNYGLTYGCLPVKTKKTASAANTAVSVGPLIELLRYFK